MGAIADPPPNAPSEGAAGQMPASPVRGRNSAWLAKHAPPLGELYDGALKLLAEEDFPGRMRFVAHAVREIVNRLPEAFGVAEWTRVEYENECDLILEQWRKSGLEIERGEILKVSEAPDPTIPKQLFYRIARLLKNHDGAKEVRRRRYESMFENLYPEGDDGGGRLEAIERELRSIGRRAVGKAHLPRTVSTAPDPAGEAELSEREVERLFERLDIALGAFIGEHFATTDELDKILEETNS